MKNRYWFGMVVCTLMAGVLLSGCGYFRKSAVNSAIKKVQEEMEQARGREADRYSFVLYNEAMSLISQAQNDVEAGNYEEAENKVQEASGKVKLAIEQAPGRRQEIQRKRKQIQDMEQEMVLTLEKAENSPSRSVAETEITQARESFTQIQQEMQALFNKKQQAEEEYDQLIARVQQVQAMIQQAYDLTLADSANTLAMTLNDRMESFLQLEPSVYLEETADGISAMLGEFQSLMDQRSFEQAIETGQNLESELESAIPAARRARAEKSIEAAAARLAQATELGGLELAAEQIQAGQEALSSARRRLDAGEDDAAFTEALQAMGSADVAIEEIRLSIERQIAQLQNLVVEAEEAGADRFAPQALERGRSLLSQAYSELSAGNYEAALRLEADASVAVETAYTEAKKGQAAEKLARVEAVIKRCIEQGAPKYVPESFRVAEDQLKEARSLFGRGEYVEVHPVADLAENLAHKTLADLLETAGQRIEQSREQVASARKAEAGQYAAALLEDAVVWLRKAENHLAAEELKRSLEASDQSIDRGFEAEQKAYRLRTDAMVQVVGRERGLAIDSGAREHASAVFLSAAQSEKQSTALYSESLFEKALEAATKAAESYRAARMSKIQSAQEARDSAIAAKAREYDPQTLSGAESALSTALLAMEDKQYAESNRTADEAGRLAMQAERTTWMKRGQAEIARWEAEYARLVEHHAKERAPEQLNESWNHGVEARAEFTVQNYKPAYERAVQAMEAVERTERRLGSEAEKTLARMRSQVESLSPLAVDEFGRQRVGNLIRLTASAAEAQEADNFKEVFSREKEFDALVEVMTPELKNHRIQYQKDRILAQLKEYETKGMTRFLPEQVSEIQSELVRIKLKEADALFDEGFSFEEATARLDALEEQVGRIPQTMNVELERSTLEVQNWLTEARQADAPNLIPDLYEEGVQSYKRMLNYPRGEGGNLHELHELVVSARKIAERVHAETTHAIDVQTYREVLQSYISEKNSLLMRFSTVTDFDRRLLIRASSTKQTDVYRQLQRDITAKTLSQRSRLLLDKARELSVPKTQEHLNQIALTTFRDLVEMADYFERFGQYDKYDKELRDRFVSKAYDKLEDVRKNSLRVQEILAEDPVRRRGLQVSSN